MVGGISLRVCLTLGWAGEGREGGIFRVSYRAFCWRQGTDGRMDGVLC